MRYRVDRQWDDTFAVVDTKDRYREICYCEHEQDANRIAKAMNNDA